MNDVTMIYVTHDQVEAMTLADRICVLRDGLVEQVGTPTELYEHPKSLFVARFIGSPKMNLLGNSFATRFGCTTLGIRSEHLSIADSNQTWNGTVAHLENLGSDSFVFVDIGSDEPIVVRQEAKTAIQIGDLVGVVPDEQNLYRFDAHGQPMNA